MTRAPWQADHHLDAAGARERLAAVFPDLRPRDVRLFGEGWDFRMFEVDGTWLFRFPKREGEILRLKREVALMEILNDRLPIPTPRYEWRATGVAGYRKLHGAHVVGAPVTDRFAPSLAAFAVALHAVPLAAIDGMELPGDGDLAGPQRLLDETRESLEKARPALDPALHARCARALGSDAPAAYAGEPRIVHADIYPEHILLADDGAIAGVLDWGDATRGDPAGDLAIAHFRGGEGLLAETLTSYGGDVDEAFVDRCRLGGTCMAVGHVAFGARTEQPRYVETGVDALDRITRGA